MGNTRYPSGLKGKASLAWVAGAAVGVTPLFIYYYSYLMKEHYYGNCPRLTYGEDKSFHTWMVTSFRHSIQMGEALRAHPQYSYSYLDSYRLRIKEMEEISR